MKHNLKNTKWFAAALALAASLAWTTSSQGAVTLLTFDTPPGFTTGAPYVNWTSATFTAGATSYDVSANGYGGQYVDINPDVDATGNTNIELTVNLTGTAGNIAVIVTIGTVDNSEYIYSWYNQNPGAQVLTKPVTGYASHNGPAAIDLAHVAYVHIQGDQGPYTIQWQNLSLVGQPSQAKISTFDNYTSDALFDSWTTATVTSGATNYQIAALNGGSNYKYIGNVGIAGAGQTTLQLTTTISGLTGTNSINPFVKLLDADPGPTTAEFVYKWGPLTNGHYVLTMPVQIPSQTNTFGNHGGMNLNTLTHSHIGVDTGGLPTAYTISWEDLTLTSGGTSSPIQITSTSYNPATHQFSLTWTSEVGAAYKVLSATTVNGTYTQVGSNVASGGATTTTTVTLPVANTGFVRIQKN